MTAPAFEFEEPEPIEASGLVRTQCRKCGEPAIAAPNVAKSALCTGCLGQGSVYAIGELPHTVPVGYPYPFGMSQEEARERSQHPAPEFIGEWLSLAEAGDKSGRFHKSALDLAWHGRGRGWDVKLRYSVGTFQSARGAAGARQESIAVAFKGFGREAVAVYVKRGSQAWKWETVYAWGPDLFPFGEMSVTDLKWWLAGKGAPIPCWERDVRLSVHMASLKAEWEKEREKSGQVPKKRASGKKREIGG